MSAFEDDLLQNLQMKRVLIVVGAGVSIQATANNPVASWTGLLENGIKRCREVDRKLNAKWEKRRKEDLRSRHLVDLLTTAESIQNTLKAHPGEYLNWLRATVGELRIVDPAILDSIAGLGVPIATTNYDDLLYKHTHSLRPISWRTPVEMLRFIRGDDDHGILHLHGHWRDEQSVILSVQDYGNILGNFEAQARQQLLAGHKTLLFIGFGSGLRDPNFRSLIDWIAKTFGSADYFHYQLARDCDIDRIQEEHPKGAHIRLVPYGQQYSDLPGYILKLGQAAGIVSHPRTTGLSGGGGPTSIEVISEISEIAIYDSGVARLVNGFSKEIERLQIKKFFK